MTSAQDYSFRKDLPILAGPVDGCAADITINDTSALILFPNGISFSGFELDDKQRIPTEVLTSKITSLKAAGLLPDNKLALIFWRDCDLLTNKSVGPFFSEVYKTLGANADVIYINGDHNLPVFLKANKATLGFTSEPHVHQTEPEFLSKMFEVEGI